MENRSSEVAEEEALVDLDGTIADYEGSLRSKLAPLMSPGEREVSEADFRDPPPWIEARMDLVKSQPGFWRGLPRIEDGFRVLELIVASGFRTSILTKGPKKAKLAWTEKVEWCEENVPHLRVTVGHDKGLVYGRLLFDDYPVYIQRWLKHRPRGVVLMLDAPINHGFEHPQVIRVMRPFSEEVKQTVIAGLARAKLR
jgi:5'-nucleotidase